MVKFSEDELKQLRANQRKADVELKEIRKVLDNHKPAKRPRKAATHLLGAKPKPMPSDEPVTDKHGRVVNVCAACGAKWDDTKGGDPNPRNRRQFTRDGVERFQCFCEPMRMFERYKEETQ